MAGFHLLCTDPLEIQGFSSGRVTLSVLLGWEEWAGSDHHLPQWAETAEIGRQTAGPWTQGRKALLTSRLCACVMGPA